MSDRALARVALILLGVTILLFGGIGLLLAINADATFGNTGTLLLFLALAGIGAVIVVRQPRNLIGWIFLATGVAAAPQSLSTEVSLFVYRHGGATSLVRWLAWPGEWLWILPYGALLTVVPLLFPDGRLPSSRWRPLAWFLVAYFTSLLVAFALLPGQSDMPPVANPAGLQAARPFLAPYTTLSFPIAIVLSFVCVTSLIFRYRRADGDARQQIKWFGLAMAVMASLFFAAGVSSGLGYLGLSDLFATIGFLAIPAGAAVAMLRYHLYDIDVVVNRAVVLGLLVAFITAVYLLLVVGIGAAVGSRGGVLLSIVATAIVAVSFQPIRERARRLANRLVYGKRASPYEVLSGFSEHLAGAYSEQDLPARMARILGEGTGARDASVWLRIGRELRCVAAWPLDSHPLPPVLLPRGFQAGGLPDLPGSPAAAAVRHGGDLLGALAVAKHPGDPLRPQERRLLDDLAGQAGLVFRNVRLIEELRASRQRLVKAQDEERRRIERNIHDGAQQQLVALAIKLNLAQSMVKRSPDEAETLIAGVRAEATDALENLRDLARGIYPPLLADKGLAAALDSQVRKAAVPTSLDTAGVGRYPQEVEAAVYFCTLEAMQNVSKYANAASARVRLRASNGDLTFAVSDDGAGFDPASTGYGTGLQGMADRLEALGGDLAVRSSPGTGTVVEGRIPVPGGHDPDPRSPS